MTRVLACAAMVAVVALTQPGVAEAATALPQDSVITVAGAQPASVDYSFQTTRAYWSVVALNSSVNPTTNLDYDLAAYSSGTYLTASSLAFPYLDFVAIDTNLRAPQSYIARVNKWTGSSSGTQYIIEYHEGNMTFGSGRTILPADGTRHASIGDVWVSAGQTVHLSVAKDIAFCPNGIGPTYFQAFLMGSNPSAPVQARPSRVAESGQFPLGQNGPCPVTMSYTATRSGWYGLIIYQDRFDRTLVDVSFS
jgi:hypothetical protein